MKRKRKREVQRDSKVFGLSNMKDGLLPTEIGKLVG